MTDAELKQLLFANPEIAVVQDNAPRPMPEAARERLQQLNRVAVTLTLPYPPSANVYWRHVGEKVIVSKDARAYRDGAGMVARHAGIAPFTGKVAFTAHFYRARAAGDLDNLLKVIIDSLRGVAYNDDKQVTEIHAYLHDTDKTNPRAELEIREVTP